MNIEPNIKSLLDTLESEAQLEKKTTPPKLSGETSSENYTLKEEYPIDVDRGCEGVHWLPWIRNEGWIHHPYLLCHPLIHWLGR